MKTKFFTLLCYSLILFLPKLSQADELKRNLFVLGVQIGGAECIATLFENFPIKDKPGAFDLIKRNVTWSLDTARAMGNPANGLAQLKSDLGRLTFKEIRQRLMDIIVAEQAAWASMSTQASSLFVLGIHLEGAECIASEVQSFRREEKPGSLDLITRNVGWIKDEVRKTNLGLNTALVDALYKDIPSGATFLSIYNQLGIIRETWQSELLSQAPF
ncbi:MAG: hypothetical protein HYU97_07815 [Deltaproteobacteria bacterium]|nr:hypothetical protein [Deltaproteobacteria bacterium]